MAAGFRHSGATAFIFAKMGFSMFQFGRSPTAVAKAFPVAPYGNQLVWRPMQSIPDATTQDIFTCEPSTPPMPRLRCPGCGVCCAHV